MVSPIDAASRPGGGPTEDVIISAETMGNNSAVNRLAESNDAKFTAINAGAKVATDAEHAMTVREAIRQYPKAIAWSMIFSLAIAMEGYDKALIGGFFAFGPFVEKFGQDGPNGRQVAAHWQASLNNGARAGEILGLLLNGMIVERFGFRKTMIGSLVLLSGFIFIPVFAQNIQTLLVADILMGIPWGVFQTLTPSYAVEVTPVALRGYLVGLENLLAVPAMTLMGNPLTLGYLRERELGLRTAHRCRRFTCLAKARRRVGLQDSLCSAVDVAIASYHYLVVCSGVALVVGASRAPGRCKSITEAAVL
jgi:SP family general alpha glucoside:H+ symporter-like MFS transporter